MEDGDEMMMKKKKRLMTFRENAVCRCIRQKIKSLFTVRFEFATLCVVSE